MEPIPFSLQFVHLRFENVRDAVWVPCTIAPDLLCSNIDKLPISYGVLQEMDFTGNTKILFFFCFF